MQTTKQTVEPDLYVDPRPMTPEDKKAISDYIKADKLARANKTRKKATVYPDKVL